MPLSPDFSASVARFMREAGQIMLSADRTRPEGDALGVTEKDETQSHVNFVTAYDSRVQAFLIDRLHTLLPEAQFFAEEDDAQASDPARGYCFIIDPIDGTANFIHDYHCSTISVGLLCEGTPVFGAVYTPYLDQLFTAEKGKGAYCNGRPIHASARPLSSSLVVLGTSPYYKRELGGFTSRAFAALMDRASDIRRSGSAAYDFASVACGRMDGFIEARLSPWDYCAGTVLVTEAGGFISDFDGLPLRFEHPGPVLCGGQGCAEELLDVIKGIRKDVSP